MTQRLTLPLLIAVLAAPIVPAAAQAPPSQSAIDCAISRGIATTIDKVCQPRKGEYAGNATKAPERAKADPWAPLQEPSGVEVPHTPNGLDLTVVLFDGGSSVLLPIAGPAMDQVARDMIKSTDARYRIEGHASADGNAQKNYVLSQERAKTVLNALIKKGVPPAQLEWQAFGHSKPLIGLDPKNAHNRRVTIMPLLRDSNGSQ